MPLGHSLGSAPSITDLEQRLISKFLQLVCSPEGQQLCLGNWSTFAIEAVLLDLSRRLIYGKCDKAETGEMPGDDGSRASAFLSMKIQTVQSSTCGRAKSVPRVTGIYTR